jgi:signal transduction histidine kinase
MQRAHSEYQDQLLRGLTHRMNNVLTLFQGYLGLLMDGRKLNAETREGLKVIRDTADEAAELIARANAIGASSGKESNLALAAFLRQLAPTFDRLRGSQIHIDFDCPEDLPRIVVDSERLRMGLVELVRNACEAATSRVKIRVTPAVKPEDVEELPGNSRAANTPWVQIAVTDDGEGIPPAVAARIYEPFYSTKRAMKCEGLGLAVALGCAQRCGGTLRHRSRKSETTFEMLFPAIPSRQLSAVA